MTRPEPFSYDPCPEPERHTCCPSEYLAWHEWAERMSKTHVQERCPVCGLFAIWVPRPEQVASGEAVERAMRAAWDDGEMVPDHWQQKFEAEVLRRLQART